MINRFALETEQEIIGCWAVRAIAVDGSDCAIRPSGAHLQCDLVHFGIWLLLDGAEFTGDVCESTDLVAAGPSAGPSTAIARLLLVLEARLECLICLLAATILCFEGGDIYLHGVQFLL